MRSYIDVTTFAQLIFILILILVKNLTNSQSIDKQYKTSLYLLCGTKLWLPIFAHLPLQRATYVKLLA